MGLFDRVDDTETPPELAAIMDPYASDALEGAPMLPSGPTAPPAAPMPLGVPSSGAMDRGRADLQQASMDKRERIIRALTILAPAIAGIVAQAKNKNPYGSGAAQGLVQGAQQAGQVFQQQDEQRRQLQEHEAQRMQQAAQQEIQNARQNQQMVMETQRFMAQRAQERQQRIDRVAAKIENATTRAEADAIYEQEGQENILAGHRDLGPNQLRRTIPYINAKAAKKRAEQAWDSFWNNKANAGAAQKPDAVAGGRICFDTDGDGVLRLTPLPKIAELAGKALMVDDQGNTITWPKETPQEGKATADGIYQDLLDKDRAEGVKDTPDRRVELRQLAIKKAAEAKPTSATDEEIKGLRADLLRQQVAQGASGSAKSRPVQSSDANRLAELQGSLDDLRTLREQLGTTGAASKVGAMVPNVVTEFTGWGKDAKSRQAVIDRVKQVIGKALEGGVLRKEDEYKYVKILPTIGDPPDVARRKLDGLERAITQRRERDMEALEDAGFDMSKFRSRGAAAPDARKSGLDKIGGR